MLTKTIVLFDFNIFLYRFISEIYLKRIFNQIARMPLIRLLILSLLIIVSFSSYGQEEFPVLPTYKIQNILPDIGNQILTTGNCITTPIGILPPDISKKNTAVKFIIVHGTVSYDFFYRSNIDTPIAQRDFEQHTERVSLDILLRDKYPLKFNIVARQSNSPFFKNFIDANFQFDRYTYNRNLKQRLLNKLNTQLPSKPDFKLLQAALLEEKLKFEKLKFGLNSPSTLQKIIEAKEQESNKSLRNRPNNPQPDSMLNLMNKNAFTGKEDAIMHKIDSTREEILSIYEKGNKKLDSLNRNIHLLQAKMDSVKNAAQKDLFAVRQQIYKATSQRELQRIATANGIQVDSITKFEKRLTAIENFSLGRSALNYTELTAQNIIINGINIEYNPSYYAAFAAGKIDYRFRDFFNKTARKNNQYLVLGRFGIGDKNKKALIFTLFQGRKSQSDFALSDSVGNYVNIMGYSVESIIKKNENNFFSAEFAKSTKPVTGNLQANKQTDALVKFSDQSNMGINFKAQAMIPETHSTVSGFFRKAGQNFQSFSLFSYNTNQTAWLARLDQSWYRDKISLTGMLRQNDFSNPFTEKTYKTTTVFKSLLLNVRFPKYPYLSFGYYPGTQLYYIDKDRIRENAYYIINGSLVYSYCYKGIAMNSSLIYNRYINQASDSGFVFYKGVNYFASQTIFLKRLQLQGGYTYNSQPELEYYTLETSMDYRLKSWLRIGGGAKYNNISSGNNYWGGRGQVSVDVKKLGAFQFQYEKSYLPTINSTLYPVEIGRVSWYKYF